MARFEYSALSTAGDIVSGELDGPDAAAIIERLHEQALLPIHAVEKSLEKNSSFRFHLPVSTGLPGRDLALFSQQLARLLKANLPLDRALEILALSKMNWNNTEGLSRYPITISFAKKVGQLMSEMSENQIPNPSYRFYM